MLKLPNDVMFFEAPQVARWHDDRKCWVSDAVTNLAYKEDQRLITFRLERFGIFTLIQDRHINMPFQSWEIRPLDANHINIHIVAAIAEVEIEIKDNLCALVKPDDKSEVAHLLNKFMPLPKFIEAMSNAGINLFPEPDSYKFVGIQNKVTFTIAKVSFSHLFLSPRMVLSRKEFIKVWHWWHQEWHSLGLVGMATATTVKSLSFKLLIGSPMNHRRKMTGNYFKLSAVELCNLL